jgi:hypothetical protein
VPASSADDKSVSRSGSPIGVAVVWLIFYIVILAGSFGAGVTRHASTATARLPASLLDPSGTDAGAEVAKNAPTTQAPRRD